MSTQNHITTLATLALFTCSFVGAAGCAPADSEDADIAQLGAPDPDDSVFVPDGYRRADLVEVMPGTFALAHQAEDIRAVREAWLAADDAGVERPLAGDVLTLGHAHGAAVADTAGGASASSGEFYICQGVNYAEKSWSKCTGSSADTCSAFLLGENTYVEEVATHTVKHSSSDIRTTITASTTTAPSSMVMISADGEAVGQSYGATALYVNPTGYKYKQSSVSASQTDYSSYFGPFWADFTPDSSGYDLEFIYNKSSGSKKAHQNFPGFVVTETCWYN